MRVLRISRASTHNLKQISLSLPKLKWIAITGRSGSGKSSLAFDTLYAEGQRRYIESLSPYARQFLSMMPKPEVESISGLSPAIAIDQKSISHNPRSTVGTLTEINDYLRLLFCKLGQANCPHHSLALRSSTLSEIQSALLRLPNNHLLHLYAPVDPPSEQSMVGYLKQLWQEGYLRVRLSGELKDLSQLISAPIERQGFDVLIDRVVVKKGIEERIYDSVETGLALSNGRLRVEVIQENGRGTRGTSEQELYFSLQPTCAICQYQIPALTPQLFSFNHPRGACSECDGLGSKTILDPKKLIPYPGRPLLKGGISGLIGNPERLKETLGPMAEHYGFSLNDPFNQLSEPLQKALLYGSTQVDPRLGDPQSFYFSGLVTQAQARFAGAKFSATKERLSCLFSTMRCSACHGGRLNHVANLVKINQMTLPELCEKSIEELFVFFSDWQVWPVPVQDKIAGPILQEIVARLNFLKEVGLGYLTLGRSAASLSGGEAQRIRLASQIGSGLTGVLYVLDEPSIGLHAVDNEKLLKSLRKLTDLGNTLVVVEHDEQTLLAADHLIELGPGAGKFGGEICAQGTVGDIMANKQSETGAYLSGRKQVTSSALLNRPTSHWLRLQGARTNNLQNVNLDLPVGCFIGVTGVSGSGKSSLINKTLLPAMRHLLEPRVESSDEECFKNYDQLLGAENFDKLIVVDQAPIGRTPRSNAATYTGVFTDIRELYAQTPTARALGYDASRFSFNLPGGRCEACQGEGVNRIAMHFLPDVEVQCEICLGRRYNPPTLEVVYKGLTIDAVLSLSAEEAQGHFSDLPKIQKKLSTLVEAGLGYLPIGQSATQLSGGEAQRVKLAKELSKRDTGKTLYLLDEPTTGLHYFDIQNLVNLLFKLRDQGNTVVVIEHNFELVHLCDWIVDLGPEGGKSGGKIIASGPPFRLAREAKTPTAQELSKFFQVHTRCSRFEARPGS